MKLISVIIPVYKVEKYIFECVNSIINQTYRNIEIILVDDGSPDECPKICDDYAKKDSRVKVIHKENGGLSSARNAGIEVCNGEYVVFVDSDDYVTVDLIKQFIYMIDNYDSDVVICDYCSDEKKLNIGIEKSVRNYSSKQAMKYLLTDRIINTSASTKAFRKEMFEDVRFPLGMIYEDFATIYKLLNKAKNISYAKTNKYYYRTNFEGITNSSFTKKQLDYYKVSKEVYEFVSQKYPKYKKYVSAREMKVSIAFFRKMSESNFKDRETIVLITKKIRKHIFSYMFTKYPILSKLYGVLISVCPKLALSVFKKNNL